ncbi:MAG: LmeA family phospholipid-binding protein [Solirubrobacteraceae bacterium]
MRRVAALAPAALLALLVIAQLALPVLAAQRLRDRLGASGRVLAVEVHAFPAVELLWHHADRVVIRLAQYRSSSGHLGGVLAQTAEVGSLDASAGELDTGLLTLRDVALHKRGAELTASARVAQADVRAALPLLQSVQPVASGDGALILRGTATLLGVSASIDATLAASQGRLVVAPDIPFGALATITVFANPRLYVQGVGASTVPGGFSVFAQGRLR